MDKESVLQKRNRAEHSSLLIVSAGFLLLCTCEVFGIITGKTLDRTKGKLFLVEHSFSSCF